MLVYAVLLGVAGVYLTLLLHMILCVVWMMLLIAGGKLIVAFVKEKSPPDSRPPQHSQLPDAFTAQNALLLEKTLVTFNTRYGFAPCILQCFGEF